MIWISVRNLVFGELELELELELESTINEEWKVRLEADKK